jgi:gluconate 2-dehydrogenase gamma chain
MIKGKGLSRRQFMQVAVSVAAAGSAVSCSRTISPWRFFTVHEGNTVEAICERIIPADQDPGAAWAGVTHFIDKQLTGHYKRHQNVYRQAIAGVDQTSLAKFGMKFIDLPVERQDSILSTLEKGQAPAEAWKRVSSQAFFALIVSHTMQGFYGDPRHGGNRDEVSWKMLGLSYPPIRGLLRYDLAKPENNKPA